MYSYLFKTEERTRTLRYALSHSSVTVTGTSKLVNVNKGLVSRYLNELVHQGIMKRVGNNFSFIDTPKVRTIKIMLNVDYLIETLKTPKWARGMGVFGSWGDGTNDEESDLDLWVKVDDRPTEIDIARFKNALKGRIVGEINLVLLTSAMIDRFKTDDQPFYHSLLRTSIRLRGEDLERT
jgi:predicted nucleotidyltransferase